MTITLEFPVDTALDAVRTGVSEAFFPFRKETGLVVVPYETPPMGKNVFTIALDNTSEVIRLWPGLAKVKVKDFITEPRPQMVLQVIESGHAIPMTVRVGSNQWGAWRWDMARRAPDKDATPDQFITDSFPQETTFAWAKDSQWVGVQTKHSTDFRPDYRSWSRDAVVTVPKSDMHFLVGYDEVKCFIARLPKAADTVTSAHKILRPQGLSRNAVRQGEWFFDPLTAKGSEQIDAFIKSNNLTPQMDHVAWRWTGSRVTANMPISNRLYKNCRLERRSSHRASRLIVIDGIMYANGTVNDSRTSRHHALKLDGWHRVVRNLESHDPIPEGTQGRVASRRWD